MALPPEFEQVKTYVALAESAPVELEPTSGLLPDQAPEAVQEVALTLLQVKVELVPLAIVLGFTPMLSEGAAGLTETLTVCEAFPAGPVQFSVYTEFALRAPLDCVPLSVFAPDHAPLARQEEAFWVDHANTVALPAFTVLGSALREICGAPAPTVTVTV